MTNHTDYSYAYDLATRPPERTPRWIFLLIGILLLVITLLMVFPFRAPTSHTELPACQEDEVLTWRDDFPGYGKVEVEDLYCRTIESLTPKG